MPFFQNVTITIYLIHGNIETAKYNTFQIFSYCFKKTKFECAFDFYIKMCR